MCVWIQQDQEQECYPDYITTTNIYNENLAVACEVRVVNSRFESSCIGVAKYFQNHGCCSMKKNPCRVLSRTIIKFQT